MNAPTFDRYLRAPVKWWPDDHPWCLEFGHGRAVPVCSCCGSGLTRHAIIDTDGLVWGMDCFATATGTQRRHEASAKDTGPVLVGIRRSGYIVWASGQQVQIPLAEGLPPELLDALSDADRHRALRRMQRDRLR